METLFASLTFLQPIASELFIADFFDVFIIALFLYAGLLLFKQTRSFSVLAGIGIIIILYGFANFFNLYLTTTLLQSFFSVFLVVLVIIFQEELRRFFELLAVMGTRQARQKKNQGSGAYINEILQAVANLSHNKMGALLVFAGNENIQRHIDGGTTLDAVISQEIIESIFDPTSPGHDGAIIINKNRIAQLGAHLPLSTNFKEIGKHGTRHSAALGIAERSDAFAIVVSEERGTISVAQNGTLTQVPNTEKLESLLRAFFREAYPKQTSTLFENIIKKNTIEKLLAITISCILWFFFSYQAGSVQRDFTLPISYRNLPPNLIIEDSQPKTLTITLESRGRAFDQLDAKTLELSIDAKDFGSGEYTVHVSENMVKRPLNFSIVNITPPTVTLSLAQYTEVTLPVHISTAGQVPKGFVLDHITPNPDSVRVLVSERIKIPASLNTTPIDLSNIQDTQNVLTTVITPKGIRMNDESGGTIIAEVNVRKK